MTTLREAAQQALEALKSCSAVPHWPALQPTITALRDALAQQEQERATLVAAAEREACADICDQHASIEGIAQRCAEQIRARGKI
jgi:hypothetical protein